jgi:hypothetical protein
VVTAARFSPETVTLMKRALDDAWDCLEPGAQATMPKTTGRAHSRICRPGERDRQRLRDAALRYLPRNLSPAASGDRSDRLTI